MWFVTNATIRKRQIEFLAVKILQYENPLDQRILGERLFWGTKFDFRRVFTDEKRSLYQFEDKNYYDYLRIPCDEIHMKEDFSSQLYMVADHFLEHIEDYKKYLEPVKPKEEFPIPEKEFIPLLQGSVHAQYKYLTDYPDRIYTTISKTLSKKNLV